MNASSAPVCLRSKIAGAPKYAAVGLQSATSLWNSSQLGCERSFTWVADFCLQISIAAHTNRFIYLTSTPSARCSEISPETMRV